MSEALLPDQFLYSRKGPWPQPSPSHPMKCADEVLNIPPMEALLFNETIGARYLEARVGYPPVAARYASEVFEWAGPTTEHFTNLMNNTLFTRFKKPLAGEDLKSLAGALPDLPEAKMSLSDANAQLFKYDFTAMDLVKPIDGTFVAPTVVYFKKAAGGDAMVASIRINGVHFKPANPVDRAWALAMIYALQGAAYHVLFVVHPALHFPMDSVNAITKTSVPMGHPLFQLFHPHSAYSLPLDNAVLESAESVVNNNAQGTRFDPLTADAYNLKLLFGAGYTGLKGERYTNGYPQYSYMEPQLDFDSGYSTWLSAYFKDAFLPFCTEVAKYIIEDPRKENLMPYVEQWAKYCHTHVLGFIHPDEVKDADRLGYAMAVYTWNASVSHGGDHWSFAQQVQPVEKCLRIRVAPPTAEDVGKPVDFAGKLFTGNDMQRAALCQYMFFQTWAIKPNLAETMYAFTNKRLQDAYDAFQVALHAVNDRMKADASTYFQPLVPDASIGASGTYEMTIPQSIQY
ncbi:hypothetical protein [Oceanibium sediminis]|uniref:hypothetical protein n=1 Tax=Oceanibium sediminis TaxID=2026339 RepID=UPI0018E58BED|nr:hypothetical protein [Oceanibium sediminis]